MQRGGTSVSAAGGNSGGGGHRGWDERDEGDNEGKGGLEGGKQQGKKTRAALEDVD